MRDNLVLVGMPASGKSTIGVVLAKLLGYDFVDSDLIIQKQAGRKLKDIIAQEGVDGFLRIEEEVNASLNVTGSVIATGGSVIYGEKAMRHLKEIGRIVYLQVSYDDIVSRLQDIQQRGVVLKENQTFGDLYNERIPLYEKYADLTIHEEQGSIEDVVRNICSAIGAEDA